MQEENSLDPDILDPVVRKRLNLPPLADLEARDRLHAAAYRNARAEPKYQRHLAARKARQLQKES